MSDLKNKLGDWGLGAVVGAVIPALVTLNIFATKADLAEMKADFAQSYVQKNEVDKKLDRLENLLNKVVERMDRLRGSI